MRAPTKRMQTLAAGWLTDTIRIGTLTDSIDVDPNTGQHTTTGNTTSVRGLIRDRTVWVGLNVPVAVGDAFTVTKCTGDTSLNGATGTVTDVERDSIRAALRFGVRLENTQ